MTIQVLDLFVIFLTLKKKITVFFVERNVSSLGGIPSVMLRHTTCK